MLACASFASLVFAWIAQGQIEAFARTRVEVQRSADVTEYSVKAQFLQRLTTPYVKWPATSFESPESPFIVAVVGKDPFGKQLEAAFEGRRVEGHPVKILRFESLETLEDCHLLFVPESQDKNIEKIEEKYRDKAVLIVGESVNTVRDGAHIGCYMEKSKLRFAIHPTRSKKAKLEISSELLKLAKIVDEKKAAQQ